MKNEKVMPLSLAHAGCRPPARMKRLSPRLSDSEAGGA